MDHLVNYFDTVYKIISGYTGNHDGGIDPGPSQLVQLDNLESFQSPV
jgi:hypothetical protein